MVSEYQFTQNLEAPTSSPSSTTAYPESLRKSWKPQNSQPPGRNLNLGPHRYIAEMLCTLLRCLVYVTSELRRPVEETDITDLLQRARSSLSWAGCLPHPGTSQGGIPLGHPRSCGHCGSSTDSRSWLCPASKVLIIEYWRVHSWLWLELCWDL